MFRGIRTSFLFLLAQLILGLALIWTSQNNPFFWDTVQLASKHAHHFFDNGLVWQALPPAIDSGHPPTLGYYLAHCWHWFGKNLWVSHWAVAPFVLLNIFLLWRIGKRMGGNFGAGFLPFLVLSDPVFLTQHSLISPDIIVVSGFLLGIDGIGRNHKPTLLTGVLLMCAFSMRGMMTSLGLGIWMLYLNRQSMKQWRSWLHLSWPFIPGIAFMLMFLTWHRNTTGWIGYHPDSPWAGAFKLVDAPGFVRNMLIIGWRWVDFGRVGLWLTLGTLVWTNLRRIQPWLAQHANYWMLWLSLLITLTPTALLYQNLSAHRYFLPAYVAFSLLIFDLIRGFPFRHWIVVALSGVFITGHLWVYPAGISNDWDCTLAHRPFYNLQAAARQYLTDQQVDFITVGAAFPDLNSGEHLFLNGDQRLFSRVDFKTNQYIVASNVLNDFSRENLDKLAREWRLIWHQKSGKVWMHIYQKPPLE